MTTEGPIPSAIAATASGSLPSVTKAEDANILFSNILSNIAKECAGAGSWMIGHIKANIRSDGELLSIGSTTEEGKVRHRCSFEKDVKDYSMTLNVIVYGLERHMTAEILVSNVRNVLGDIDIEVHSEVGCEDPECGDPMCQDEGHQRIITIE
jgi:hypothetical protein